ncbi:Soluble lytic murein transglycosylase [Thalassocella blandensis]|nr:Soluble lytic murein transglycosylase [Thalassocella blandensis]
MRDFTRFVSLKRLFVTSSVILFSGASLVAHALAPDASWFSPAPQLAPPDISEQRYSYELAKSALAKDDLATFRQHYARLGDYPLVPYLDYALIKDTISLDSRRQVDRFLETNSGSFLAYKVREQWLYYLATQQQWDTYLAYYQDMGQSRLECYSLYARLEAGDQTINDEVAALWSEGKSHPKACDKLFDRWMRQDGLTNEIAWQRFLNAMEKNRRSLAKYVSRKMDGKYREYADLYIKVDAQPSLIKQHRVFSEQSPEMQHIIARGVQRLARYQPKDALYHWELYEAAQMFDPSISTETKIHLAKRLTWNDYTQEAADLIAKSQELRSSYVVEYLIREGLKNQEWENILSWINAMDESEQQSDRWLYWRARAQDELKLETETEALSSQAIYHKISKNRSFYGFLASDILGQKYSLEHETVTVLPSTLLLVEKMPSMLRAKELWLRGNYEEAQAEWRFAVKKMDEKEIVAAGRIAQNWGWYNKAIVAMIISKQWNDLDLRFPLAYEDAIAKVSASTNLEPNFIYAIARQESAFSERARSSAGAMGLMQLMPATARQTALKSGIKHRDQYLLDPEYNINLGSQYMTELMQQFNGNRILAIAAYNAGPHRVNRWVSGIPKNQPFDVWIETIPFKETRGYVQNVLAFSVIYAYRMGKESTLITEKETKIHL